MLETTSTRPLYRHPEYSRWYNLVQRYCMPESKLYRSEERAHVTVCDDWAPPANTGFLNFKNWIEAQFDNDPSIDRRSFRLYQRDLDLPFSPENCYLRSNNARDVSELMKRCERLAANRRQRSAQCRELAKTQHSFNLIDHMTIGEAHAF